MQLYRDLPLLTCFEFLKEAVIADFRWLFDMNNISVIENGFSTASLGFRI